MVNELAIKETQKQHIKSCQVYLNVSGKQKNVIYVPFFSVADSVQNTCVSDENWQ